MHILGKAVHSVNHKLFLYYNYFYYLKAIRINKPNMARNGKFDSKEKRINFVA